MNPFELLYDFVSYEVCEVESILEAISKRDLCIEMK